MHRTQIYLPDEQTEQLDARAGTEGVSRSALIRRAVEEYLAREEIDSAAWQARWREAVQQTAGIAPYLSTGADYVERVREADAERLEGFRR
jgi:metal-responsive CopG/Arc/MetJ family transcriptional regulator